MWPETGVSDERVFHCRLDGWWTPIYEEDEHGNPLVLLLPYEFRTI